MANKVTLTFAGDESDLTRSIDTVGRSTRDMSDTVGDSAGRIDRVGESADQAETRFTGLASGIDGVTTLMDDPSPQEFAQAIADMADGVANFAVPTVKRLATALIDNGRAAVVSAGQHAVAAARTVASWVVMGVQAMVNAAKMAAAWLISLGPVGLVIAAVGAVIAILVALGVDFDDLKRIAEAAWQFILGAAQAVWNWLSANWPLVLAILTGPIGLAVLAIQSHWETIKAGATAVKDWVTGRWDDLVSFVTGLPGRFAEAARGIWDWITQGVSDAVAFAVAQINRVIQAFNRLPGPDIATIGGGKVGASAPKFHGGGIFRAPPGMNEGLAWLSDGEKVSTPGQAGGAVYITVQGSILSERQLLGLVRDELQRGGLR